MIEGLFSSSNYVMSKKLLDVADVRHQALGGNIANAETPGYKRVDLDRNFEMRLREKIKHGDAEGVSVMKPAMFTDKKTKSMRADGNNVQIDQEMLKLNRNALEWEFHTQFVSSNLKRLESAIRGRPA